MKIYSDGKSRVLNGAFPKHFRLLNGEKEVPFIRTGRESIRISGELPVGDLLVDEIIRQKVAQPAKLDAQSLAIINKQDFDRIDILNKKLAINQEKMGEQMNALAEHEATLANLETKNAGDIELLSGQTASAVQMLKVAIEDTEKKNVAVQKALSQAIKETSEDLSDSLVAHETAKNPHRITKATIGLEKVENIKPEDMPVSKATKKELDKKADKKDIAEVEKKLTEKSDKIVKGIERMNMLGGVGGNELPVGGKKGYVLAKASNKTGDYEWKAGGGGVSIHNDLDGRSAENAHPMSAITGLGDALDSKYDASNPDGYITGIDSLMVTTALGYTPYNASNPNGYQTAADVSSAVGTETTNRQNADNALQSQIDAITASSDVKDIVGTYAQLQAYDTSTLGNNDIIKVLQDETHSDETTYYRWSTATETFTLIGEEGPYYTKSEANSTFVPQTTTVNGKALSGNITLTYSDVGAQPAGNYVTTDTAQTITGEKTFTEPVTIQNGQGTGCLLVGANVNSSTLSNNQRKLARINAPSFSDVTLGATLIGWDTSGDNSSPVTNNAYDAVCFGGMKKITNCTSPMSITFCVTDTRAATSQNNKKYPLAMDANEVIFGVQPKYNGNNIATVNQIPTDNASLTNGAGYITSSDIPVTDVTVGGTSVLNNGVAEVPAIPSTAADVGALPDTTKYGADLDYTNSTLTLLDQDGNALGNSVTIIGGGNTNNLLDFKWTDHELNDQSWLRADTFSWQDGEVYSDAFNHLEDDYTNGTLQSETIGSYTIDYILAPDGHKIVMANNETTVANIYDETGVAWYYVLDRVNDRFKLPRTKYGFNGYRDTVGKYIPETLPNITGSIGDNVSGLVESTGAFSKKNQTRNRQLSTGTAVGYTDGTFDASNVSSTYQNNAPVQERATQMYLYFYVGQFSQSATEQTAGLNSELFNGKVDLNAANLSTSGKSLISGLGMPSNRYENLTLGSSGSIYTAPANGYFVLRKTTSGNGQQVEVINNATGVGMLSSGNSGAWVLAFAPAKKGESVYVAYTAGSTTRMFRFIYAEGEENV